jgi:hypothetical protein
LRTVKLLFRPLLERAMQTPSKFCTRERSPSTTFTATRSVSPGAKTGTLRVSVRRAICSAS